MITELKTWDDFDSMVNTEMKKLSYDPDVLLAHLTVLLVKKEIGYQTPVDEIQLCLKARFNVEYDSSNVDDMINILKHQEAEADNYVLENEDYFEGY